MLILAIDTATPAVTAGLVRLDEGVIAERVTHNARAHAEVLTPQIQECLREVHAEPSDVGAVVAGVGPGPFTGLRVGLATAMVFADAVGCPTYAVCTLDAIATEVVGRISPEGTAQGAAGDPFLVATDARRREIYWTIYDASGIRTHGPEVAKPATVRETLESLKVRCAAGPGARLYADVFGVPVVDAEPTTAGLVAVAQERIQSHASSEVLTPLYLRRPDVTMHPQATP